MSSRGRFLAVGTAAGAALLLAATPALAGNYQPRGPDVSTMTARGGSSPAITAAAATRGSTYGGVTSEHDPIVFGLSAGRKVVVKTIVEWRALCASGMGYPVATDLRGKIPIDSKGRIGGETSASIDLGGGLTGNEVQAFVGTVRGRTVSGTWRAHVDVVDSAGATKDSCDITFTFKATSARGRVFAGATSQHAPLMLTRSSRGTKVNDVRIGWQAPCSPQGVAQIGDELVNFPIKRGRFGDDFTDRQGDPSAPVDYTYSIHGRLGATSGSGTFRGAFTESGTTCDSGPVSWKVASG